MRISMEPVTRDNLFDVLRLKPKPEQEGFVAANAVSIAEAYVKPYLTPRAVYNPEGEVVGFIMYTGTPDPDDPDGSHWIYRLMVGGQYQGNGYGRAAMERMLEHYRDDPTCHTVRVSFEPHNVAARRLYLNIGFEETGKILGDRDSEHELIVELDIG